MAVQRYDLNACIGCMNCVTVCPMDVFRFDYDTHKSVIAYPENCQGCGQCFVGCMGRSLEMSWYETRFAIPVARAVTTKTANKYDVDAKTIATPAEAEAAKKAAAEGDSGSGSGSGSWSGNK